MAVEDENDPNKLAKEREMYEQGLRGGGEYDNGRSVEAVIAKHSQPETVLAVLRDHIVNNERFTTNVEQRKDFRVQHLADTLQDKEEAFSRPLELLIDRQLVQPLDDNTRAAVILEKGKSYPDSYSEQYMGMANEVGGNSIQDFTVKITIPDNYASVQGPSGRYEVDLTHPVSFRRMDIPISYYGKPEEREARAERYADMRHELNLRHDVVNSFSQMIAMREYLFKLAEGLYFRSSISSEGLGKLFNLRSQEAAAKETVTGVELESMGAKIDTALRLYFINSICEKKSRLEEIMKKPGWKQFLFPEGTNDAVVKEWIGDPSQWTEEVKINPDGSLSGNRKKEDIANERRNGSRGRLTQKNIFAESDPYQEAKLDKAIEDFIGGSAGGTDTEKHVNKTDAESARRIAYKLFRLFVTADVEGYEIFKDDKNKDPNDPLKGYSLVFENGPAASDLGKVTHPALYIIKSYEKGRDFAPLSGLKNSLKFYQKAAVDFFRQISHKKQIKVVDANGNELDVFEDRSIMEDIWGNEAGGNIPGDRTKTYKEEPAIRLGGVPWSGMSDEDLGGMTKDEAFEKELPVGGINPEALHSGLYLTTFMIGREAGFFDLMTKTNLDARDLLDEGWWKKIYKMLDVATKKGVAIDGRFKGKSSDEIKKAVRNLNVGMINGIILGIQSTSNWQAMKDQPVKYVDRNNISREKAMGLRVMEVAKQAYQDSEGSTGPLGVDTPNFSFVNVTK